MKDWLKLTKDERTAARDGAGQFEIKERMNSCLNSVPGAGAIAVSSAFPRPGRSARRSIATVSGPSAFS